MSARGFFEIGIVRGKSPCNVGTLWRTASQLRCGRHFPGRSTKFQPRRASTSSAGIRVKSDAGSFRRSRAGRMLRVDPNPGRTKHMQVKLSFSPAELPEILRALRQPFDPACVITPIVHAVGSALQVTIHRIRDLEETLMSRFIQLSAAIAALGLTEQSVLDGVTNLTNVVQTEDAAIQAAIARIGETDDADVQALIDAVTAQQTNLQGAVDNLATLATDAATQKGNLDTALGNGSGSGGVAPTVTDFSPTSGPVGTVVTVTGTGFTADTQASFNGSISVTAANVASDGITADFTVPNDAVSGPITVANGNGTAVSPDAYSVG